MWDKGRAWSSDRWPKLLLSSQEGETVETIKKIAKLNVNCREAATAAVAVGSELIVLPDTVTTQCGT